MKELWFVWNHPNLSAPARAGMEDPTNELLLSPVSFWEIAIKLSLNRLTLATPYQDFMDQAIADLGRRARLRRRRRQQLPRQRGGIARPERVA